MPLANPRQQIAWKFISFYFIEDEAASKRASSSPASKVRKFETRRFETSFVRIHSKNRFESELKRTKLSKIISNRIQRKHLPTFHLLQTFRLSNTRIASSRIIPPLEFLSEYFFELIRVVCMVCSRGEEFSSRSLLERERERGRERER